MESKATNTTFYVDVATKQTTTPVKGALKPVEATVGTAATQKKPAQNQKVSYALPASDLPSTNRGPPQPPPRQAPAAPPKQPVAPANLLPFKALPKLLAKRSYTKCHLIRRMMLLRLSAKILLRNLNFLNNEKFKQFTAYFVSEFQPTVVQARKLLAREVAPVLREVDLGQNSLSLDPASLLADPKRQAALVVVSASQKHLTAMTEAIRRLFCVQPGATIQQHSSIRLLGTPRSPANYATSACFLPSGFLTPYELCRVPLNTQASTGKVDPDVTRLLICCHFFLRLLIREVLLKPESLPGPATSEKSRKYSRVTSNFRYLACYVYHLLIREAEEEVMRSPDESRVLQKNLYRVPRPSPNPIVVGSPS